MICKSRMVLAATRALTFENFCQQALAYCRSDPTSIKLVSVQRCAYDGVV
jgi:hypothetical protein